MIENKTGSGIPDFLNNNFMNCFLKSWKGLTRVENNALHQRKRLLNNEFIFTEAALIKLRKLNDALKKKEERIIKLAECIFKIQQEWLELKLIDDYEIEAAMQCWNNSYYTALHKEFEGYPFYKDYFIFLPEDGMISISQTENWNEFKHSAFHPLANETHCYTFYYLYGHTPLAWEDILRIEEIWIELKVNNQFFSTARGIV